jgi:hypothetical protein
MRYAIIALLLAGCAAVPAAVDPADARLAYARAALDGGHLGRAEEAARVAKALHPERAGECDAVLDRAAAERKLDEPDAVVGTYYPGRPALSVRLPAGTIMNTPDGKCVRLHDTGVLIEEGFYGVLLELAREAMQRKQEPPPVQKCE